MLFSVLSLALAAMPAVLAHGNPEFMKIDGQKIEAWVNDRDAYANNPSRIMRKVQTNSAITDVKSNLMTCNVYDDKAPPPAALVQDVTAGSDITYQWNDWTEYVRKFSHHGPIITWMAKCANDDCKTFNPTGEVWFKVAEEGFHRMATNAEGTRIPYFATDRFAEELGSSWKVTVPADLKPGQYLMRHELIALHLANKVGAAEYYPSCIQLNVKGSGNGVPGDLVSIPGTAYDAEDPGLHFNLYAADGSFRDVESYPIPGPPVYKSGQVAAPAEDAPVSDAQFTTTRKAVASAPKTTQASVPKATSVPASASVPKTASSSASASRRPWRQKGHRDWVQRYRQTNE